MRFIRLFLVVVTLFYVPAINADTATEVLKNIARLVIDTLNADDKTPPIVPLKMEFDVEDLSWDGGTVSIGLSNLKREVATSTRSQSIEWVLSQPAYGSAMSPGDVIGRGAQVEFQPDIPGIWKISARLQEQQLGQPVSIRLLQLTQQHPRIYLNAERIQQLRSSRQSPVWAKLKKRADLPKGEMLAKALVGVVTQNPDYCRQAIGKAKEQLKGIESIKRMGTSDAGDIAVVYDWCFGQLGNLEKKRFVRSLNHWGDQYLKKGTGLHGRRPDTPGLGNYWPRFTYSFGIIGLATYGENERSMEWMDYFRHQRWPIEKGFLDFIDDGGGWPEGIVYDAISNFSRMRVLDAWKVATGENLFKSSRWFEQRFGNLLLHHWPGVAEEWGHTFHPYASNGDYERGRGTMDSYWRIAAWILVNEFPDVDKSQQLRAYLKAPETGESSSFIQYAEFLWNRPEGPSQSPTLTSHFDRSMGNILLRSGWPDGADDLDTNVTHINFRCGDFFTYHQHFDQNSFILYKHSALALDSGIYSGNGTSRHDSNYFIRTIAHNTLVVYNPDEDMRSTRYNASSNDGGQRPMKPATRAPETLAAYERDKKYYDTGDILRFSDSDDFSYILGDATKAYNNTSYNQAMDTDLKNNIAKLKQFQREFLYIRPQQGEDDDYIVIYDRVAVTKPKFSGQNTKLLFHIQNEPLVHSKGKRVSAGETLYPKPDQITAVNGDGKLMVYPLLPDNLNVRIVGGLGAKANWVFGENYNWHWEKNKPERNWIRSNFEETPYGQWRIEIEPGDNKLEHNFLTVLHPTRKNNRQLPEIELLSGSGLEGAHIKDKKLNRIALFHRVSSQSNAPGKLEFSYTPTSDETLFMLFGLQPGGRYSAESDMSGGDTLMRLSPSTSGQYTVGAEGVLSFRQ